MVTTVELSPDALSGVRVMLVHRWPRGVYLDPYQLTSLSDQSDWQVGMSLYLEINITNHIHVHYVLIIYALTSVRYY